MQEQLVRELVAEKERMRDLLAVQDRQNQSDRALAILQTRFDNFIDTFSDRTPTRQDLANLKKDVEDDMKEVAKAFRESQREERERWLSDMRNVMHENQMATQQAIKDQHSKWLNRAMIVGTLIISVLIGGIEQGISFLQRITGMPT